MLDWNLVEAKAREIVLDTAKRNIPGSQKAEYAVDALLAWLDAQIEPQNPLLESASDWVIREIIRPALKAVVRQQYNGLRDRGMIAAPVPTAPPPAFTAPVKSIEPENG